MADPDIDVIDRARRSHDALTRGDVEAFLRYVHPDVEFMHFAGGVDGNVFRGHDGVREGWVTTREAWSTSAGIEDVVQRPGGVIFSGGMHIRVGQSGFAPDPSGVPAVRV